MPASLWTILWLLAGAGACLAAIVAGLLALRSTGVSRPWAHHHFRVPMPDPRRRFRRHQRRRTGPTGHGVGA